MAKKEKIKISDHARVRYIERVIGIDIDEIDQKIVNEKTLEIIETFHIDGVESEIPLHDPETMKIIGRIILKDNTVITVKTPPFLKKAYNG